MMRRLFTVASVLSLVLFVITMVLWVRSQWTFTRMTYTHVADASDPIQQRRVLFLMWRDAAEVMIQTESFHPEDEAARARLRRDLPLAPHTDVYERAGWSMEPGGAADAAGHWGFWYRSPEAARRARLEVSFGRIVGDSEYQVTTDTERAFFLPWWFLAIVFAWLPCIMLFRRVGQYVRRRAGRCPACGYDLRASPDRCPECGAIPEKHAASLSG
jgi:hypothetical protein